MYITCITDNYYHDHHYISYSWNLLREEIFANPAILLSEKIFAIFDFNLLGDFCDKIKTHGSESRGQEEAGLRDEPVSYLQVAPL